MFAKTLSKYAETSQFTINLTVFQQPLDTVDVDRVIGDFTSSLLLKYAGSTLIESVQSEISHLNDQLVDDLGNTLFSGINMMQHLELATNMHAIHIEMMATWSSQASTAETVTVILPKGWCQIATMFAILCSGQAYIPIKADLPPQQVALILKQAGCTKAVVCDSSIENKLGLALLGIKSIWLEKVDSDLAQEQQVLPIQNVVASLSTTNVKDLDMAYIIFTSGSTGVPKGVVILHKAAINTINNVIKKWSLLSRDVAFGVSKLNFDLSMFNIFGPLSIGGGVVIPPAKLKDPDEWAALVIAHKVTIWNLVPMIVQMLLEASSKQLANVWKSLQLVMMSGNWIPILLACRLLSLNKENGCAAKIISLGGATEASIWSIYHTIIAEDVAPEAKSIPYRRPLANQRMHVAKVDADGNWMDNAPTFAIRHLFISGTSLADRYTDSSKTKQAFITHPVNGERLYRTGNLARYLDNGKLEFVGRSDFQVKV